RLPGDALRRRDPGRRRAVPRPPPDVGPRRRTPPAQAGERVAHRNPDEAGEPDQWKAPLLEDRGVRRDRAALTGERRSVRRPVPSPPTAGEAGLLDAHSPDGPDGVSVCAAFAGQVGGPCSCTAYDDRPGA